MTLLGTLLLVGEYLCVETAMRCLNYNPIYTSLGALATGCGIVAIMLSLDYD